MNEHDTDQIGQFTRISQLLRNSGLDPDEANELTERIKIMLSNSVFDRMDSSNARLESKIDAQNTKIDAQNTKYNTLIIILSILAATGILGFLSNIFNWGGG